MTSDPFAVCPRGHKAKKVEIQVQSTELEFEGGEGEGTNSTHSGKKGRSAAGELNANKGPCPSSCCHTQQKKRLGERSHIKGNRMGHISSAPKTKTMTLLPLFLNECPPALSITTCCSWTLTGCCPNAQKRRRPLKLQLANSGCRPPSLAPCKNKSHATAPTDVPMVIIHSDHTQSVS